MPSRGRGPLLRDLSPTPAPRMRSWDPCFIASLLCFELVQALQNWQQLLETSGSEPEAYSLELLLAVGRLLPRVLLIGGGGAHGESRPVRLGAVKKLAQRLPELRCAVRVVGVELLTKDRQQRT